MLSAKRAFAHQQALGCAQFLHVASLSSTIGDAPFDTLVNAALDILSEMIIDKSEVSAEKVSQFDDFIMHLQVMIMTGSTLPAGVCGHRLISCIMPVQLRDLDAGDDCLTHLEQILFALSAYQRLSRYGPHALRQAYQGTCAELQTLCAGVAARHASCSQSELRTMYEARTFCSGDLAADVTRDEDILLRSARPEADVLQAAVRLDAREMLGHSVVCAYTSSEMWRAQLATAEDDPLDAYADDASRMYDLVRTDRLPDWCLWCMDPAFEGYQHLVRRPSSLLHVPMLLLILDLYQTCAIICAAIASRDVTWIRCLVLALAITSSADSVESTAGIAIDNLRHSPVRARSQATRAACFVVFYHTQVRASIVTVGSVELIARVLGWSQPALSVIATTFDVMLIMSTVRFFLAHAITVKFLCVIQRSLSVIACATGLLLLLTFAASVSMHPSSPVLPTGEDLQFLLHGAGASPQIDCLLLIYRAATVVIALHALIAVMSSNASDVGQLSIPMATRTKLHYRYMQYARHHVIPGPVGIVVALLKFAIGKVACRYLLNAIIGITVVPTLAVPWAVLMTYCTCSLVIHQIRLLSRRQYDRMFPYIQPYTTHPRLLKCALALVLALHIPLMLITPIYISMSYIVRG